jgi:hypothetical protein
MAHHLTSKVAIATKASRNATSKTSCFSPRIARFTEVRQASFPSINRA